MATATGKDFDMGKNGIVPSAHRGDSGPNRRLLDNALSQMDPDDRFCLLECTFFEAARAGENNACEFYLEQLLPLVDCESSHPHDTHSSCHREYLRAWYDQLPQYERESNELSVPGLRQKMLRWVVRGFNPAKHDGESETTIKFFTDRCAAGKPADERALALGVLHEKLKSFEPSRIADLAWWIEHSDGTMYELFSSVYMIKMNAARTYSDFQRDVANSRLLGDFASRASAIAQDALAKYAQGLLEMEQELADLIASMNVVPYTKPLPNEVTSDHEMAGEIAGIATSPDSFCITLSEPSECSESDAYVFAKTTLLRIKGWKRKQHHRIHGSLILNHPARTREWTVHEDDSCPDF